jgi:predicted O-methyltransferase YrrM
MNGELWTEADRYLVDLIVRPDQSLQAAREVSVAAGLPSIEVSPNQGKLLMVLALATNAKRVLEIGTLGGYSTIWLAKAMAKPLQSGEGCLLTVEAEPKHAAIARENIARAGLAGVVGVREGRAADVMAQLAAENLGPFDLIFIDADKPGYVEYFEWALKLSRPGTVIFADNVVRKGAVLDANSQDPSVQGARRFNERLAAEPRVVATAMQTVGTKGHDGFALAVVVSV